jgi:hypothetical protein
VAGTGRASGPAVDVRDFGRGFGFGLGREFSASCAAVEDEPGLKEAVVVSLTRSVNGAMLEPCSGPKLTAVELGEAWPSRQRLFGANFAK